MTRQALNVIGQPYNSDAVMIGRAYDHADSVMREDHAARRSYFEAGHVGKDAIAQAYVKEMAGDRRYTMFVNASSGIGSIVTYKGVRYYVEHVYNANEKSRTSYVYRSHN